MGSIQISGTIPLYGETKVQGSKNAALPLIAAAVLHRGTTVLHNCPYITDVILMCSLIEKLGCKTRWEGSSLWINASGLQDYEVDQQDAERMRASVLLLGSLLGRLKKVLMPYPGGCVIGKRPVNFHLDMMKRLGAKLTQQEKGFFLEAEELKGTILPLPFPSVGATENSIIAAVFAKGTTRISGAAREPEIDELCCFLTGKGALIKRSGNDIVIEGVSRLRDSEYTLMPDRIVAGTYMLAAAGTGGKIVLDAVMPEHLKSLTGVLEKTGCSIRVVGDGKVQVDAEGLNLCDLVIETAPYPGFPTDLQSQLMAAFCRGNGRRTTIREKVFEHRFRVVEELRKTGAEIRLKDDTAVIFGREKLYGSVMKTKELRGGAALVIAGLMCEGNSLIENDEYIDRGYENISRDFTNLGARIRKLV